MLHVYKASAGSGKTYTLTQFYLKICFDHPEDPAYFRHILTMTFTNAATAEMKARILAELKNLAFSPERAEHLDYLADSTQRSKAAIQSLAEQILRQMMERYSSFSVTTIDSFFQSVLRLFTRELDIKAGYTVELNTDAVLDQAIHAFLEDMHAGHPGLYWIEAVLEKRWEEGKSNSFQSELGGLGRELFNEGIYEKLSTVDPDQLLKIRQNINAECAKYERNYQSILEAGRAVLEKFDLSPDSFSGKSRSKACTWLNTYAELDKIAGDSSEVLRKFTEAIHDPDKWLTKATKGAERDHMLRALDELYPLIEQSVDFILNQLPLYQSYRSLRDNIESFGFLSLLEVYVQQYCEEHKCVLISETTELLRKVIDHQMLPFFYERMGERFDHILLDEFQDTSTSQWENLEILVENAVAQVGGSALIVGDVKQAIYRWRNGDWSILQFELQRKYAPEEKYKENELKFNWRSQKEIVSFNNDLYAELSETVGQHIQEEYQFAEAPGRHSPLLANDVYSGGSQTIHKGQLEQRNGGYVQMDFFLAATKDTASTWGIEPKIEREEQETAMYARIKSVIIDARKRGYNYRDMCILVRKATESKDMAEQLLIWQKESGDGQFPFTSPEIVRLDQSFSVQLIMAFFQLMQDRHHGVARAEWNQALSYLQEGLEAGLETAELDPDLTDLLNQAHSQSLWEIAETLIQRYELSAHEGEIPFLQEFQDQILEFAAQQGGHVREWLQYWKENNVYKESVVLPEEQDAIRLMTIHKSKGKEFPIVILPFLTWGLTSLYDRGSQNSTLWLSQVNLPTLQLPTFPVKFNKRLGNSSFEGDFQNEIVAQLLDSLNLLYVATTRPENELYIFPLYVNGTKLRTVGDAIFHSQLVQEALAPEPSDPELGYFSTHFGKKKASKKEEEQPLIATHALSTYPSGTRLPSLSARLSRTDLSEAELSPLSRGSILHQIMEQVFSAADLDKNLTQALESGQIDREQEREMRRDLLALLEDPTIGPLLSNRSNFLAERNILLPDGSTQRPDRVLSDEQKVKVIDFKSGEKYASHQRQVQTYIDTLQSMQSKPVEGYLIYLDKSELVSVTPSSNSYSS